MKINKYYLIHIWLLVTAMFIIAIAGWLIIDTLLLHGNRYSFDYHMGWFAGTIVFVCSISIPLLGFLYLLFYMLTAWFHLSEVFIKCFLIGICLITLFIQSHIDYPNNFFHPFYMVYSGIVVLPFVFLKVYESDNYYA